MVYIPLAFDFITVSHVTFHSSCCYTACFCCAWESGWIPETWLWHFSVCNVNFLLTLLQFRFDDALLLHLLKLNHFVLEFSHKWHNNTISIINTHLRTLSHSDTHLHLYPFQSKKHWPFNSFNCVCVCYVKWASECNLKDKYRQKNQATIEEKSYLKKQRRRDEKINDDFRQLLFDEFQSPMVTHHRTYFINFVQSEKNPQRGKKAIGMWVRESVVELSSWAM